MQNFPEALVETTIPDTIQLSSPLLSRFGYLGLLHVDVQDILSNWDILMKKSPFGEIGLIL